MVIVLCGKSAAGKDTMLQKMVNDADWNIEPIISYTSRPKREGEIDGREYHFISKYEFLGMMVCNMFVQSRQYMTNVGGERDIWYYGSTEVEDLYDKDYVVILDLSGANKYRLYYGADNCIVVMLEADSNVRKERAIKRGSFDETEWDRREKDDLFRFDDSRVSRTVDFKIQNDDLENTYSEIMQFIKRQKETHECERKETES